MFRMSCLTLVNTVKLMFHGHAHRPQTDVDKPHIVTLPGDSRLCLVDN